MRTAVVAGNPKLDSRTLAAATTLARAINPRAEPEIVDLAALGTGLLEWGNADVAAKRHIVSSCDLVIFASPTYKGSYTGLLKLFLDQFAAGDGLSGVVAIPFMVGGSSGHQMAPEVFLKPVLVELGASCPTAAVYLTEAELGEEDMAASWLDRWVQTIRICAGLTGHCNLED